MGNDIEFIDLMNNEILKDYSKVFKKILKKVKKEVDVKGKLGLSVTLCNDSYIHELNKTYRNKDMPTDVLSFAIEDGADNDIMQEINKLSSIREIGDIIINYDRACQQAEEYNHSLKREMCFLFTHGVLHLLGYDHMNKDDEEVMFSLQRKILDDLKIVR